MRPFPIPGKIRLLLALSCFSGLSAGRASAAAETLLFLSPEKETLYVHIDYARDPDIAPTVKPWKDMHVDSFYVSDSGTANETTHLRYTHPFYAELGGHKGAGTDYIYYDHAKGQEPHYTANIGFDFLNGDTTESWFSSEGHHLNDDSRVWAYEDGVHDSTEMNFTVDKVVGGMMLPRGDGFTDFLARRSGWTGAIPVSALARGSGSDPMRLPRGLVLFRNGATLAVPPQATRLLLLDAAGRTAWKAEALIPGDRLAPPAGLRTGAFRRVWLP